MDRIVLPIDEDTLVPNMEANYIANVDGVSVESMCATIRTAKGE